MRHISDEETCCFQLFRFLSIMFQNLFQPLPDYLRQKRDIIPTVYHLMNMQRIPKQAQYKELLILYISSSSYIVLNILFHLICLVLGSLENQIHFPTPKIKSSGNTPNSGIIRIIYIISPHKVVIVSETVTFQ